MRASEHCRVYRSVDVIHRRPLGADVSKQEVKLKGEGRERWSGMIDLCVKEKMNESAKKSCVSNRMMMMMMMER